MIPILDNSDRARRVVLFFYSLLAIYVLLILSSALILFTSTQTVEDSEQPPYIVMAFGLVYLLVAGVYIGVVIVYIQWFRRAYHNIRRAGQRIEMGEGWAAGSWFTPFANFVLPYRIMKEIWYKTQITFASKAEGHGIVTAWWAAFILGNFIIRILSKASNDDDLTETAMFAIISAFIEIISILLAVRVVRRVAHFEELFKQRLMIETVGEITQPVQENDVEEEFY
jgi:membrane protein YdbS with pleckstrin-like domain